MTFLSTETEIADATLEFIDEVLDVEDARFMHTTIVHRFTTQPEKMAQIMMCLTFWASMVEPEQRVSATGRLAVERVRKLLEDGKLGDSDFTLQRAAS